jgi:polar amino acid transport system substrate-binding protein
VSDNKVTSRRDFVKYATLGGMVLGSGALAACKSQAPVAETTPTGNVLERIIKDKKMNVAAVIYPPDIAKEGDELKGIFIEAAKWLGTQMDVAINFVEAEFGTFVAAIQTGRADVAVASTFATVARSLAVDFTRPIYYLGYGAMTRVADVNKWRTIDDADQAGVTFVEREGTPVQKWLVQNLKNAKLTSLAAAADPTQMALEVMAGRADVYIEDDWLVKSLVNEHSAELAEMPAYAETPWKVNRVAWAVPQGQPSLLNLMNVAINSLLGDGMLQGWTKQFGGHGRYVKELLYSPGQE